MIYIKRLPGFLYYYRHTIYALLLLFILITYVLFSWNILCSNIQALRHVKKVCDNHQKGLAIGNLCGALCDTNDINSITCHSFKSNREAIFSAKFQSKSIVFKSVSNNAQLHWYNNGILKYPTEDEFFRLIRKTIKAKFNITPPHDIMKRLTHLKPLNLRNDAIKRQKEMDNIWKLIQDNEFVLSTLYSDRDVYPQIIGTCGNFYSVEYLKGIDSIPSLFAISDSQEEWGQRLKIGIMMMEFIDELDIGFHEPFHLCDVKIGHFGLNEAETRVKFIDLQGVYPKSVLDKYVENNTCMSDEDCEYFDCRGRCDKNKKKCISYIHNNNLQIICEKIFLGWKMSNKVLVPGLLMSQHTPSELAAALRQCANPYNEDGKPRATPDDELKKHIYNILVEMEQIVNKEY